MDPYQSEQEQLEQLKKWWKENGKILLLGLALGISAVLVWHLWVQSSEQKKMQAAQHLDYLRGDMRKISLKDLSDTESTGTKIPLAVKDKDKDKAPQPLAEYKRVAESLHQFIVNNGSSVYALDATLLLAKLNVQKGDFKTAQTGLEWVVQQTDARSYKHQLAKLRLARVLRDQKLYDQAHHLLRAPDHAALKTHFAFVQGTVYEAQLKCSDARNSYQLALQGIKQNIADTRSKDVQADLMGSTEFKQRVEQQLENVVNC